LITVDESKLREVLDALETGLYCTRDKAEDTHASYKGYYPERHASVDRDVADIEAAIGTLQAMLEQKPSEPVAYMMVNPIYGGTGKVLCFEPKRDWHSSWEAVPLYTKETT